jgi:hypothetical protein
MAWDEAEVTRRWQLRFTGHPLIHKQAHGKPISKGEQIQVAKRVNQ